MGVKETARNGLGWILPTSGEVPACVAMRQVDGVDRGEGGRGGRRQGGGVKFRLQTSPPRLHTSPWAVGRLQPECIPAGVATPAACHGQGTYPDGETLAQTAHPHGRLSSAPCSPEGDGGAEMGTERGASRVASLAPRPRLVAHGRCEAKKFPRPRSKST